MAVACDMPPREKKEKKQEKEDIYNNTIVIILYLDSYSRLEDFGRSCLAVSEVLSWYRKIKRC